MNEFGGNWTIEKIEIFMKYVPAYLTIMHATIMNNHYAKKWKLMYFDGFAGSGEINGNKYDFLEGVATQVLKVDTPRVFDMYYFVEADNENAEKLKETIKNTYPERKNCFVVSEDFNQKALDLAKFLKKSSNYKVLAFIDPYGMEVNWASLEALKNFSIDMWILVPTGMGVNRLLKKDGNISDAWLGKLSKFLGMNKQEILDFFYKKETKLTLFGNEELIKKEENTINKVGELYQAKLKEIFKFVSIPYPLKNSQNSTMYHFLLASNNKTAQDIANDIMNNLLKL